MPKKRYAPEEIVAKLRQVDVLLGQGKLLGEAVKSIGVFPVRNHETGWGGCVREVSGSP
jgi:hypothetical protein